MRNRQIKAIVSLGRDRTDPNGEPFREVFVSLFTRADGSAANDWKWDRNAAWCSFEHTGPLVSDADLLRLAATALNERADLL